MQEEGTSAGLDGAPAPGMSRAARTADEAEAASKAAEDMTPVTYNYSFFHFIFALASMYLAMLMTGGAHSDYSDSIFGELSCHSHWHITIMMQPCSQCKLQRLLQCRQGKLPHNGRLLSTDIDKVVIIGLYHRVGNRGGGEGSNRCGLVLCMGEIRHTVGDSRNILLDACGTHSIPR